MRSAFTFSCLLTFAIAGFCFLLSLYFLHKNKNSKIGFLLEVIGIGLTILGIINPEKHCGIYRFLSAIICLFWTCSYLILQWPFKRVITTSLSIVGIFMGLLFAGLGSNSWFMLSEIIYVSLCLSYSCLVLKKLAFDSKKGDEQ